MEFPIIKKEDQSMALEVPDALLQQLTSQISPQAEAQLKESQGKVEEAEAQLKESQGKVEEAEAQLNESQGKVGVLEAKLTDSEGRTMEGFSPTEKADFVIAWAKGLSPEDQAIFAGAVGIPIAAAAEVAEVEGEPETIQGKTDKPGYKYLEHLNLSVKE